MSEPKRDDEPTMEEILASIRKIISEDDPDTAEAAPVAPAIQGEDVPLDADGAGDDAEPEPMELTQMVSEDGSVVDLRADRQVGPASVQGELVEEEVPGEQAVEAPTQPDRDEESETATVKPLVPQGAQVHAELVGEDNEGAQPVPQEPESESRDSELVLVPETEVGAEIEPEAESEVDAAARPEDPADIEEAQAVQAAADPEPESLVSAEATAAAAAAMSRLKDKLAAGGVGGGSDKSIEALVRETMAPHLKSWLDRNLPELVERIVREEIEKLVKQTDLR